MMKIYHEIFEKAEFKDILQKSKLILIIEDNIIFDL